MPLSTLNPEGTEWAYTHRAFNLRIPKGLVKQARKNGDQDQWANFTYGNRNAVSRTEADAMPQGGALVRMARCKVPPSRKIHEMVQKQLAKFSPSSWIYQNKDTEQTNAKSSSGSDQMNAYECTSYYVFRLHLDGELIYEEILGCATYEWVEEGDDEGGGDDFSNNEGDSCDPSAPGPMPIDCPIEIIAPEPCDTNDEHPVLDEVEIQSEMYKVWEDSYGTATDPLPHNQRNEAMFMVLTTSSGYEIERIPPGPETSSCYFEGGTYSVPSNIAALIHTHPYSDGDTINDPRCNTGIYDGDEVSGRDGAIVQEIKDNAALPSVPMYVMDKDKIRVIKPSNPSQYSETINRCGY